MLDVYRRGEQPTDLFRAQNNGQAARLAGRDELLGKIVADISGAGTLILKTIGPDTSTTKTWSTPSNTLAANPNKYGEWKIQHIGETIAIEFQVNASTHVFQLSYMTAFMNPAAPSGLVREHSA